MWTLKHTTLFVNGKHKALKSGNRVLPLLILVVILPSKGKDQSRAEHELALIRSFLFRILLVEYNAGQLELLYTLGILNNFELDQYCCYLFPIWWQYPSRIRIHRKFNVSNISWNKSINSNFNSRMIKHDQHQCKAQSGWSNIVFSLPSFWETPSLLSSAQAPWWTNSLICWSSSAWISSSLISHWIRVASFSSIYAIADASFCKFSCKNIIFKSRHFQMVITYTLQRKQKALHPEIKLNN